MRSFNLNLPSSSTASLDPNDIWIRHYISVPYLDYSSLETMYVQLLDSAQKKIRISTPYFRPTKRISAAIERAVARQIDVELITRLNLKGDTAGGILSETNKNGVNKFWEQVRVYEFQTEGIILHTKMLIIDDELSMVGSVNLNKRSFTHDTENAVLIRNKKTTAELNEVLDSYLGECKIIDKKQKLNFFYQVLIKLADEEL